MTFRRNLLPTAIGISLLVLVLDFLLPFAPRLTWLHEAVLVCLILSLSGVALAQLRRLGDAERRLERASISSLEGHWELDYLKLTRWHSASFEMLLGHEPRERFDTVGEAGIATHPDDRLVATQTLQDHITKGVPLDFVVRLAMADGSHRWFRLRGGVMGRNADGGPARVCGAAQDVHDQKLAEDQLRQVRARFERAVHGTQ
ncbi:MAG: PAS domain-containing protein, partial [Steroidobacteraceae bacterium]